MSVIWIPTVVENEKLRIVIDVQLFLKHFILAASCLVTFRNYQTVHNSNEKLLQNKSSERTNNFCSKSVGQF